jgi:hypothetical protein
MTRKLTMMKTIMRWWHRFQCRHGKHEFYFVASDHRARRCQHCKLLYLLNDGAWGKMRGWEEPPASRPKV